MKEITRIHLAAVPYNVEVTAKKELEQYLRDIEMSLGADLDAMREIEGRMVELLAERGVSGEKVITEADVKALQRQLGDSHEFVDDDGEATERELPVTNTTPRKKLYRDIDHQMLTGVCAGIAAYTNVDVVIIRLAFLLLMIPSFGMTIAIYFVLLLVMPPARTAAEKLEMAGDEVTLEALKLQSELQLPEPRETPLLSFIRILIGVGFIVVGFLTIIVLMMLTYRIAPHVFDVNSHIGPEVAFPFGFAGVAFVLFCFMAARSLLLKRFNTRVGYSLLALAAIGTILVAAGGVGARYRNTMPYGSMAKTTTRVVDIPSLEGVTKLEVSAEHPVVVSYDMDKSTEPRRAQLQYNGSFYEKNTYPKVAFVREGAKLRVELKNSLSNCRIDIPSCREMTWVSLSGPKLERITASGNNRAVYTSKEKQPKLAIEARDDSVVELSQPTEIEDLAVHLRQASRIDATSATIYRAGLQLESSPSSAQFATITSLNLTVPEACSAERGSGEVRIVHAGAIMVNGAQQKGSKQYPCAHLITEE